MKVASSVVSDSERNFKWTLFMQVLPAAATPRRPCSIRSLQRRATDFAGTSNRQARHLRMCPFAPFATEVCTQVEAALPFFNDTNVFQRNRPSLQAARLEREAVHLGNLLLEHVIDHTMLHHHTAHSQRVSAAAPAGTRRAPLALEQGRRHLSRCARARRRQHRLNSAPTHLDLEEASTSTAHIGDDDLVRR